MPSDRSIRRYRRWYARLLRLYPKPFYERFGETMAQTFSDLMRERMVARRGLHGFAVGTYAETTAEIIRENIKHMPTETKILIRWLVITAALLLVPFLVMQSGLQLPDPGSDSGGLDWGPLDFAIVGVLIFGAGLLYEYASRRAENFVHRAAVAVAVGGALLLVWVNLAVGMIGEGGNAANITYVLVVLVALIGASIGRFEPREASIAMFGAALAQALIGLVALAAGLPATLAADAFFVGLWVASGLLFRQAQVASSPAP